MHLTQLVTQREKLWLATCRTIFLEFIRHLYHTRTFNTVKERSHFPISIASLIKFDVIIGYNTILVNRDVMLGRCRVDVGSM